MMGPVVHFLEISPRPPADGVVKKLPSLALLVGLWAKLSGSGMQMS